MFLFGGRDGFLFFLRCWLEGGGEDEGRVEFGKENKLLIGLYSFS